MNKPTQDENCIDALHEAIEGKDGIVSVNVQADGQQIIIDYDPEKIGEQEITAVAETIAPVVENGWETCTMRLGKHGGRACESCALNLENQLHKIPGIRRATASYLGGALRVEYDSDIITPEAIAAEVEKSGIPVEPSATHIPHPDDEEEAEKWFDSDRVELIFTVITFISMFIGLFAEWQEMGLLTTVSYVIAFAAGGAFGLKAGIESLMEKTVDIDLLMILAALGAAFIGHPFEGAMLLFLFSLSNVLQAFAMDRTRNAIRALMELRPNEANVKRDGQIITLPIESIAIGDTIVVKPGERVGLDGVVAVGHSAIDQASITGESMPVDKVVGDDVFAGTMNTTGHLEITVDKLAKDSTIARLIQMVEEAHSEKAETQRFIDDFEQYCAAGVIVFTILAIIAPQVFGAESFADSFYRAMTLLVAASPCALVISTPATVLSAIGNGAKRGILFKGGAYVENAATVKVIAFDKTGTLTIGEPEVTDIVPLAEMDADAVLQLAAAVEAKSEHPLAHAAVRAAKAKGLTIPETAAFQAVTGKGVWGDVDGKSIHIGNMRYFAEHGGDALDEASTIVKRLQAEGKTSVVVAEIVGDTAHLLGVIAFADQLRPDAKEVIAKLRESGIEHVVMLTGDNETVANSIAGEIGLSTVYADLLPEDKVAAIKEVQARFGPTAMIGDGVNDAPALATADIGIAMGAAGSDVALETADIVLMSNDLHNIPYLIGLSRQTRKTLIVNIGFALFMIAIMITAILTVGLSLPLAVLGHEGGTVLVSLNGMRMLNYKEKE